MADDLTVQAQVQPQVKRKDNTLPYTIGGAAIGGAAGAAFPLIKTKYSSWEDVVNESEDTFKQQIDKGGDNQTYWETARDQAQKIKDAEKNYDAEVEKIKAENKTTAGVLPEDNEAAKKLKEAQSKYDAELANKMKGSKSTSITKKTNDILPYDANWSMTEAQRSEYQTLYSEYESAKNAFDTNTKTLQNDINTRKNSVIKMFDEIQADAESNINPKSKKRKAIKNLDNYLDSTKSTDAIENALRKNNIVKLTDTELIKLAGGEKAVSTTRPLAGLFETVFEVTKRDGSIGYVKVQTSKPIGKTEYQRVLDKKFDQTVDTVAKDLKTYIETKNNIAKLPETMKFDKGLLKAAGIERDGSGKLIDFANKLADFSANSAIYETEMKAIEQAKLQNFVPKSGVGVTDANVQNIMNKYGANSPKEAYEMLSARTGIVRKYNTELQTLQNKIDGIVNKDGVLSRLEGRLTTLKNKDVNLRNSEQKIRGKFKDYIGKVTKETSTTTTSITEAEAKKLLEGSDVDKTLKSAKEAAEKEIEKLGLKAKELSSEELEKILKEKGLGTKAEYTEKVRKSAQEAIEKNLEKYTKGNRGWTALAGAAVLALAGLGIAAATKKDA